MFDSNGAIEIMFPILVQSCNKTDQLFLAAIKKRTPSIPSHRICNLIFYA